MPIFVHLVTITAGGLEPDPAETAARYGGEDIADYLTLGAYGIGSVTSFHDVAASVMFALSMAGEGHTRTETMRAFDVETFREIVASLEPPWRGGRNPHHPPRCTTWSCRRPTRSWSATPVT